MKPSTICLFSYLLGCWALATLQAFEDGSWLWLAAFVACLCLQTMLQVAANRADKRLWAK